jgi:hypothetical protein
MATRLGRHGILQRHKSNIGQTLVKGKKDESCRKGLRFESCQHPDVAFKAGL